MRHRPVQLGVFKWTSQQLSPSTFRAAIAACLLAGLLVVGEGALTTPAGGFTPNATALRQQDPNGNHESQTGVAANRLEWTDRLAPAHVRKITGATASELAAFTSGSCSTSERITSVTTANPSVITTSEDYPLNTGQTVVISGVGGATQANGTWVVTALTATTFSIPVNVTGAYNAGSGVVQNTCTFPPPAGGNAGWIIQNGEPNSLPGKLEVKAYDAYLRLANGTNTPAQVSGVTIRYVNPNGAGVQTNPVAPNGLRWIQFVCTSQPATTAAACNLNNATRRNTYIDGQSQPFNFLMGQRIPFYWTEVGPPGPAVGGEQRANSGTNSNTPPFTFSDTPRRPVLNTCGTIAWRADLYLVAWNLKTPNTSMPFNAETNPNGMITILQGLRWGFNLRCVATDKTPSVPPVVGGGAEGDNAA